MVDTSERGAIGGGASSTYDSKITYNTPPVQVANEVRDGSEFILLVRDHQSSGFKAWSSADKQTTQTLMDQAMRDLSLEPATT